MAGDLRTSVLAVLAEGPTSRRAIGDALHCDWLGQELDVALRRLKQEKKITEKVSGTRTLFLLGDEDADAAES
jgi:hypothetical protein